MLKNGQTYFENFAMLTLFFLMFPFDTPENIFRGIKREHWVEND